MARAPNVYVGVRVRKESAENLFIFALFYAKILYIHIFWITLLYKITFLIKKYVDFLFLSMFSDTLCVQLKNVIVYHKSYFI